MGFSTSQLLNALTIESKSIRLVFPHRILRLCATQHKLSLAYVYLIYSMKLLDFFHKLELSIVNYFVPRSQTFKAYESLQTPS